MNEMTKTAYYEPWRNRATVKGMTPGRQYIFNISGETRIGRGLVTSLEQRMPILGKINCYLNMLILINYFTYLF